eukprot:TRINITY_DN29947_c0_g1_i5.p1 TRINITY_DN29947_c0_g1~~TRINITY_DN29947_c0_g1_i5.p1  ORF type:complete len:153 (+),score=36.62 TRINITY_DN29947_c0_g1_i5:98-556(+)
MRRRLRRPQPGPAAARGAAAPAAAAAGGADDDAAVIRAKRSWWLCDFCALTTRPGWFCMHCGDAKVKGLASPKCADGPQGDFLAAAAGDDWGGAAAAGVLSVQGSPITQSCDRARFLGEDSGRAHVRIIAGEDDNVVHPGAAVHSVALAPVA